ncbi:response regulator transcription factor [Actinoalloteichus spitiensis]|uniref:response regulator transcription factor n=1 Tax=Actinoalloteichus spitiensis TaxID=252394 RepID=UPI000373B79B|nr:response regulator transcription factor [Actinoalloteichus spitiensis]
MRVLVVEDEPVLARVVAAALRRDHVVADVVGDGATAQEHLGVHDYDVVVLDRDLPLVHGDEVCRDLVASGATTRVLMLTASAEVPDRVVGLALGADDYLVKPFALAELVARVRALGRRSRPAAPPVLSRAGIELDPRLREVRRAGELVALTPKQFTVLEELLRAEGAFVSAEHLLEKAWDEHVDPFTGVVRLTVLRLRRALGEPNVIETTPGVGYRIR